MKRWSALLATAALVTVPPSLFAQAALTGGRIGVLGPASSVRLPSGAQGAPAGRLAQGRAFNPRAAAPRRNGGGGGGGGGGCQIFGFLNGGLNGGGPLNSIGAFDVTGGQPANFNSGTSAPNALAIGGQLTADAGAINPTGVIGSVPRNAGTLFQFATASNCGAGTPFTTTLTSNPAGTGGAVVASANTLRMQATYSTQYVPDPNNPYWCYYTNNPNNIFQCNLWSAQVTFNFLTSSFAAVGAASYSLSIVQATITSP